MLPVVDSDLPYHVSDISVLSKYQALEATPTSTSPPRVDSDLAAKFNFADDEEPRPPNSTSKSEAADADLDFEHDRMTIVASWRAHADLLMLFVRPVPYIFFLVETLETPHANHMLFMDGRAACSRRSSPHNFCRRVGRLGQSCRAPGSSASCAFSSSWETRLLACLARFRHRHRHHRYRRRAASESPRRCCRWPCPRQRGRCG